MNSPEEIDVLLLRSILGETTKEEDEQLANLIAKNPDLLEKRRELQFAVDLLGESYGNPPEEAPTPSKSPKVIRFPSLRTWIPIAGGIAACFLVVSVFIPSVGNVRMQAPERQNESQFLVDRESKQKWAAPTVTSAPTSGPYVEREFSESIPGSSEMVDLSRRSEVDQLRAGEVEEFDEDLAFRDASEFQSDPFAARSRLESMTSTEDFVSVDANMGSDGPSLERRAAPDLKSSNRNVPSSDYLSLSESNASDEFAKFLREEDSSLESRDSSTGAFGLAMASPAVPEPRESRRDTRQMRSSLKSEEVPATSLFLSSGLRKERKPLPEAEPAPQRLRSRTLPEPTFTSATENPFSTFSLNVTDVSFRLAARQLAEGLYPDAASIRPEEFYNAFDYRDQGPGPGQDIRFGSESASLPAGNNLKVVRLSVKTATTGPRAAKPAQITFAIDNSGSMQRSDRKGIVNAAFTNISNTLNPADRVNVVTFAATPRLEIVQASPSNQAALNSALNTLPDGGTNLEAGLQSAYEIAQQYFDPQYENRVVLLSDGVANLGQTEAETLAQLVEENRLQGIAFDGFGVGWENLNDPLLAELASSGDGQYGFLESPDEAAEVFARTLTGSLRPGVRDVKVQVEWNPERVQNYRLIGYETHRLTKEQFRDDSVDAAEVKPEQTGNALYLLELTDAGTGPLGTARVRFKREEKIASTREKDKLTEDQLASIVIPRVTIVEMNLSEAILELSGLMEANNSDRNQGISIVAHGKPTDQKVNFSVRNLRMNQILDILCHQVGMEWNVFEGTVNLFPLGDKSISAEDTEVIQTVQEVSWLIPTPTVWPEIDQAAPALQLATTAAVFAEKLQDPSRFPTIRRIQLLDWIRRPKTIYKDPSEVKTLEAMINNASFLP